MEEGFLRARVAGKMLEAGLLLTRCSALHFEVTSNLRFHPSLFVVDFGVHHAIRQFVRETHK
jgi:hypothetical protein